MTWPRSLAVRAPHRLGCVDLTPSARDVAGTSGIEDGALMAFCTHTTCALLINEWENGVLEDLRFKLDELFPVDVYYAHDDLRRRTENLIPEERRNGHAHVAQMLMGQTSQLIPISAGDLLLGRWQRLFLLELDEPKERTVVLHAFGRYAPRHPSTSSTASVEVPSITRSVAEPTA